jgi:uncharacterized protein
MTDMPASVQRLKTVLVASRDLAIAVSGGVDSMTLAVAAARWRTAPVVAMHAVSPAVPAAATERVRTHAERERWDLRIVDAGEFGDAAYRANPANRCFFCKTNLYATMTSLHVGTLASGTNLDDLGDWRPGLAAAETHGVRHPFVEAGIDKAGVRALARHFGLADLAELPAAPCLSSRVETGIAIDPAALAAIDRVETAIRERLRPETVRCRQRRDRMVIELDDDGLRRIEGAEYAALRQEIAAVCRIAGLGGAVDYAPYRRGSAFLHSVAAVR